MVWRSAIASLSTGIVLCFQAPIRAEDFSLKEYEKRVHDYVSSLENLSVELIVTDQAIDGSFKILAEHAVVSIPKYFRAKSKTRKTFKDGRQESRMEWSLLRPDGYYKVTEKAEREFLLYGRASGVTSPLLISEADSPITLLTAPVSRRRSSLLHLLRGELKGHELRLLNFRKVSAKGSLAYSFSTRDAINGANSTTNYELNDRWLLSRHKIVSQSSPSWVEEEITYTTVGDRLLPGRITIRASTSSGKVESVGEFRNYQAYEGSVADFSLRQFGLPEAVDFDMPQSSGLWPYLLAGAALFLGVAVLFRWLQGRVAAGSATKT